MDTLESLRRKADGAADLKSVVRTMKAMAASNIGQYETALSSLKDYSDNVVLGIAAYLGNNRPDRSSIPDFTPKKTPTSIIAIVFGSDQGLVGQFNDSLTGFVSNKLGELPGEKKVWAIGERVGLLLSDADFEPEKLFLVPGSVQLISPLVGEILIEIHQHSAEFENPEVYIFHNQPKSDYGYTPVVQKILPLDENWLDSFIKTKWPSNNLPQVVGDPKRTLSALIREYLFISLFRACAESLASENASRLQAMQRAEKSIQELVTDLGFKFNRLRQSSIDEELFDVVSGFEALKD
ncbi:F0F1 ATP synthase subunit gamma [Dyadobacter psychrotolerans]|uniref:F0F1 ATP synthase subunit gamma n=1 Tax=Dyadobacter psychrotolerans TaxID=2541721 RepID=A0A4R5DUD3_9BACT|nr:F0F1 ATP synthase subunit gamma [Dyadobacter psychrotolerans]TDE18102.1 F0F1 ATP synthase subunit gamma [Dyadobacter psychrotolerans]